MTCEADTIVIGDEFLERAVPHHRWKVIGQRLAFELVCVEQPHRFRFLTVAALTDPQRYVRTASQS